MKIEPRKEWLAESGYCNCLLVVMCRLSLSVVELAENRPVPDLESLAKEKPDTVAWLRSQEFDYTTLDSRVIVKTLSRSAGISRFPWGRKNAELAVVDVPGEDEAPVNRQFHFSLSKVSGSAVLSITLQRQPNKSTTDQRASRVADC